MRYLSLFSGIEAATQAWEPLGWKCVAVSEIEPFPCAVLEHHYPNVPNLGDVTKITEQQIKNLGFFEVLVFGSPCQNLSVSGNRKGFSGDQSKLFFAAIKVIQWARKHCGLRFALWENVPGAFSSNKGADFTEVVKHMAGLSDLNTPKNGWGKEGAAVGSNGLLEWSVLDAQWFGLAQRRKRVFAIVDFGNWQSRPPILLERHSLRGSFEPSGTQGEYNSRKSEECPVFAIQGNAIGRKPKNGPQGSGFGYSGVSFTLTATDRHAICYNDIARYLTPVECEKLQGFPENFTKISNYENNSRYKAIGNSMAVNVMAWIGQKVQQAVAIKAYT